MKESGIYNTTYHTSSIINKPLYKFVNKIGFMFPKYSVPLLDRSGVCCILRKCDLSFCSEILLKF